MAGHAKPGRVRPRRKPSRPAIHSRAVLARRRSRAQAIRDRYDRQRRHRIGLIRGLEALISAEWGRHIGVLRPEEVARALGWIPRLEVCCELVVLRGCPDHPEESAHATAYCCTVASCPCHQHRKSLEVAARVRALMKALPATGRGGRRLGWRMVTLTLRSSGRYRSDLETVWRMRRQFWEEMKRRFHGRAMIAGCEKGRGDNWHVHLVVYSSYVSHGWLEHWQRQWSCTIPGCPHPADDRCSACKHAGTPCHHPPEDGRAARCNGSWSCNIQMADEASGWEIGKYTVKGVPKDSDSPEEIAALDERAAEVAVILHSRKRIESYGLARPGAGSDEWQALLEEELEKIRAEGPRDGDGEAACPVCGCELMVVGHGVAARNSYRWRRGPPPEPALPAGVAELVDLVGRVAHHNGWGASGDPDPGVAARG